MIKTIVILIFFNIVCQSDGMVSNFRSRVKADSASVVIVGSYDIDATNAQVFSPPYTQWQTLPGMPRDNSVRGVQSACWGNVVYIGTSYTSDEEFYAFNLTSRTWSTKAFPNKLLSTPSATELGGQLYFAGGQANDGISSLSYVQQYDPSSDRWSGIADLNVARSGAGMVGVGDALYICGGFSSGSNTIKSCESYSFADNKWTMVSPMINARGGFNMVAYGSALYAMGTLEGAESERYNPVTDKWSSLPNLPKFRKFFGTFVVEGKVCVAGGVSADGSEVYDSVDCFDVATSSWSSEEPKLKYPQWWFSIAQC